MITTKKIIIATIGAFLIIGLIASGVMLLLPNTKTAEKAKFLLTSEKGKTLTIAQDEKLILRTNRDFSEKEIRKAIAFTPKVNFSIKKIKRNLSLANFVNAAENNEAELSNAFEIVPSELALGEVYNVKINDSGDVASDHDYSWAFQVEALFQAVSSFPGDKASDVPLDSGIEITFNRDRIKGYENNFEILPKIEGKFELNYNTLVFIPEGNLQEKTLYTVTIKKGLTREASDETSAEDFVFAFETESAQDEQARKEYINWSRDFFELPAGKESFFPVYASKTVAPEVVIYKFGKSEDFRQEYFRYRNRGGQWSSWNEEKYLPEKVEKIKSFNPELIQDNWQRLIEIPDELENGYYILEISHNNEKDYAFAQKSPLAFYYSTLSENGVLWLYDYEKKAPASGISISFFDKNGEQKLGETNESGILEFSTPEGMKAKKDITPEVPVFFEAKKAGMENYIILSNDVNLEKSDKYWNYLMTDRPIYQLRDKINYWGAVKGRDMDMNGKKLTIGLYREWSGEEALQIGEATVSPFGTYSGNLEFAGIDPGFYSLIAKFDDEVVSRASIQILSYAKPLYKLEVSADKENYWTGENVKFRVRASFFDGTALANAKLNYSLHWQTDVYGQITLDAKGEGEVLFKPEYYFIDSDDFWTEYPQSLGINFSPASSEEGEISGSKYVSVFGPSLHIQAFAEKSKDDNYKIEAQVNRINIKNDNYIGEAIVGQVLSAKIIKYYYEKKEIGEVYDVIYKKKIKQYDYELKSETVETASGATNAEGKWTFAKKLPKIEFGWYRIIFTGKDEQGKNIKTAAYTGYDYYPGGNLFLGLKNLDIPANKFPDGYKVGDPINLEAYTQGEGELVNGKIMFFRFTDKMKKAEVIDGFTLTDTFSEEYVPSVRYTAVAVGSNGFLESGTEMIVFDKNENKLEVSIETDKERYRPKEKIKLTFNIKDKDKKNVKTAVNASVVDEALFNIVPGYQGDILSSIYNPLTSWPASNRTIYYERNMGAEKGGGSGNSGDVRTNFIDVPLFQDLVSDDYGNANAEFMAPDNITAWRVTANAFSQDKLVAGSNTKLVPVGLPLFVDVVLNKSYLAGDAPILKLRAFGDELKSGELIEFSLQSADLKLEQKIISTSTEIEIPTGALPVGSFKILIGAKQGNLSDTIEREINIVDNHFRKGVSEKTDITSTNTKIKGNPDGFTHIAFVDGGSGKYFNDIVQSAYSGDIRSDRQVAAYYGGKLLEKYFGKEVSNDSLDLGAYYHAGLSLFPYSDTDIELSAKLSDIARETVSALLLKDYFYSQLDDKKTDQKRISTALYGLASLNEPVLSKIDYLINSGKLDNESRIYLGSALAKLGAKEAARGLYRDASTDYVEYKGGAILKISDDENYNLRISAMAGVLASYLDESSDLEKIWTALATVDSSKIALELEKMMIIQSELTKTNPEKTGFDYKTASRSGTADLSEGKSLALYLSQAELESFEFFNITGKPAVIAYYEESTDPNSLKRDSNIQITRQYLIDGKASNEFKDGETVLVRLDEKIGTNAVTGEYTIIDFLPAGLKPLTDVYNPSRAGDDSCNPIWYPIKIVDNAVYFSINEWFLKTDNCPHRTINYYARVVNKGEFRAQPAIIQSVDRSEVLNLTGEGVVVIR